MVKYNDLKTKLLSDPEVKKEYDDLRLEYEIGDYAFTEVVRR